MSGAVLKGVNVMSRRLQKLARQFPRRTAKAAKEEFEIEKKESVKRTPKLTGALRESHKVLEPVIKAWKIRCDIVVTMPYAIHVHEDLEAFHKVGQAKFLESTLLESKPYMARRIADRIELSVKNWGSL